MLTLRPARREDLPTINEIYNHFVLHSTCTYQTEPSTLAEREAWFDAHGARHPVIVAEDEVRVGSALVTTVVGWGALNQFHPRAAYGRTVENSVYLHHEFRGQGRGGQILQALLDLAEGLGHHVVIAIIDAEQKPSVGLHTKYGFVECGYFKEVGYKFGRWLDVVYMQKILQADS